MLKEKSYARVTLALDIIKKNKTGPFAGFHRLGIIKQQIDLYDEIEIKEVDEMKIICNDHTVPVDNKNICWQVVDLLKKEFDIDKNILITLQKNIPAQGGLAGGSSNAATTFRLLNMLWGLDLTTKQLIELGRKIGKDVSYFFIGGTAFDSEDGSYLRKIETDLQFDLIIVLPDFGVSTVDAYGQIDYTKIAKQTEGTKLMEEGFKQNDKEKVLANLHNDFELPIFHFEPRLKEIKQKLSKAGVGQIVMSGSGSTMIGVLDNKKDYKKIKGKLEGLRTVFGRTISAQ